MNFIHLVTVPPFADVVISNHISLDKVCVYSYGQASLSEDSAHAASLGAILLGSGQPVERLCSYFVAQEKQRVNIARPEEPEEKKDPGVDPAIPWVVVRLHILDTLGVMCGLSDAAIQTVVASGSVPYLLGVLRYGLSQT